MVKDMSFLRKYRSYIIVALCVIFGCVLLDITNAGFFDIFSRYISSAEYRALLASDYRGPWEIFWGNLTRSDLGEKIIFSTTLFQLCITFIAGIGGIMFAQRFRGIEKMKYYRYDSSRSAFYRLSLSASFKWALAIFAGYLVVWAIFSLIAPAPDPTFYQEIPRTLFLDILGNDFYFEHTSLYWLLEGMVRFLWVPFTYAFFTCALVLTDLDYKLIYLVPNLYYIIMTAFSSTILSMFSDELALCLNPSVIMASGSYELSTISLLIPTLIPLLCAFIIAGYNLRKDFL